MGQTDTDSADSLLAFYDPANGSLKRKVKLPLRDVSGLAYSPKTHILFATDVAWKTPRQGGLFALWIDRRRREDNQNRHARQADRLAFDPVGHLYVSVLGTGEKKGGRIPARSCLFQRRGFKSRARVDRGR